MAAKGVDAENEVLFRWVWDLQGGRLAPLCNIIFNTVCGVGE